LLATLESLQPYNEFIEHTGHTRVGSAHPLYILNAFWNQDKHHVPLKVTATLKANSLQADVLGTPFITTTSSTVSGGASSVVESSVRSRPSDSNSEWTTHVETRIVTGGPISSGVEFARCTAPTQELLDRIRPSVTVDLTIDETAPAAAGSSAARLYRELYDFVHREVVVKLEPFFP
jgi:hypothetical protein